MKSSDPMRCFVRFWSASDWTGFSPMTQAVVSSPRSMASNIWLRCQPFFGGTATPQAASNLAAESVVLDVLEARQAIRQGAHVAAALDVVLAAQRVEAAAVLPDVAGERRQVDEGQDVVDRVVVLGDAEASSRSSPGRRVAYAWASSRMASAGHARLALGVLERVASRRWLGRPRSRTSPAR